MEYIPTPEELAQARPDVRNPEFVEAGGFKAVFRATVGQAIEAVKVIYIPPAAQEDNSRDEIAHRVRREIEALRLCRSNRLVKLSSLELQAFSFNQRDYLIYSEEFLEGETLKARIALGHRPDQAEVILLARCLMEAIGEV